MAGGSPIGAGDMALMDEPGLRGVRKAKLNSPPLRLGSAEPTIATTAPVFGSMAVIAPWLSRYATR